MRSQQSQDKKYSCAGFVLAGGKSSRLGAEKAFLEFGDGNLLERSLKVLRSACGEVAIVGDAAKFESYGSVVPDVFRDCGPLGGIHAALAHSGADLNLMMAVDLPFVTAELLVFLRESAAASASAVIVPRTASGLQPLCAVYRRSFAEAAEQALRAGKYKIDALFSEVSVRVIGEEELAAAGFSERAFFNINTGDDLRSAQRE